MIVDLEDKQLFKPSEYDEQDGIKTFNNEKIRKLGVRFAVDIKGNQAFGVWEDLDLRQSWIDYIRPQDSNRQDGLFDYLCGVPVGQIASQHPKNINPMTGNAKLLSCNDMSGYTFRGRFSSQNDAVIVDYEQSQKMHQTLRWLVNNYGHNADTQTIIEWAVDSDTSPPGSPYKDSVSLWAEMDSIKTEADKLSDAADAIYANYSEKLKKLLQGYGRMESIKQHARTICVAVFDAATTGRMGLTFYQEMPQDDYLKSMVNWHEDTSYYLTAWKRETDERGKEKSIPLHYFGAPSYDDILFAIYGRARGGNDAGYSTLRRKVRKQLLECMFGRFQFPKSMVDMAAVRASHPMSFTDSNGSFNPYDWQRSVNITCALAHKYYKREAITLALDETRRDRDYLYGRLLAAADRLEQNALYKADKSDTRTTNAIRLMGAFSVKPYHTWGVLHKQLIPYINQLGGNPYYFSVIKDVLNQFDPEEYKDNSPLSPVYLLGFSAQDRAFWSKNNQENLEGNNNGIAE
jgi:CRISPR-associated protein Csd1